MRIEIKVITLERVSKLVMYVYILRLNFMQCLIIENRCSAYKFLGVRSFLVGRGLHLRGGGHGSKGGHGVDA